MEEDVVIISVKTGEAVKNIQELKENLAYYRKELNTAGFDGDKYEESIKGITEAQNALRAAMNGTAQSAEELTKANVNLDASYNGLVNQMAELKKAWRATTDEAVRANLGAQINSINDRLKEMDASVGNFQRNVGDYANGVKKGLDAFTKGVGNAIPGLRSLNAVADGFAKNPFVATIGLLVGLFAKIIQRMKSTEEGQARINKLMAAVGKILEPINAVIGWIADKLGQLFDWLGDALGGVTKFLRKITSSLAGVGNAILQYILAPIRTAISVIKGVAKIIGDIFTGKWGKVKEDAKEMGQGIGDAWKKGFAVKANFKAGKDAADNFLDGIASKRKKAKETGKGIGQAVQEGIQEGFDWKAFNAELDKSLEIGLKKRTEAVKQFLQDIEDFDKEVAAETTEITDQVGEQLLAQFAAQKQHAEDVKKTWQTSISAVASLLGSLADIYEASADKTAASEKKIKALRIASATISMIQGAIGAYTQAAANIAAPWGMIIGAANAATITASGLANIAKMRSTSLSGSSSTTATASYPTASVSTTAPVQAAASPAALATLANDTRILNAMGNQRVYILASDIEASNNARKVQVAETTF